MYGAEAFDEDDPFNESHLDDPDFCEFLKQLADQPSPPINQIRLSTLELPVQVP